MAVAILSLIGSNKKNRPKNADILYRVLCRGPDHGPRTLARDGAQREKNGELRTVKTAAGRTEDRLAEFHRRKRYHGALPDFQTSRWRNWYTTTTTSTRRP